MLPAKLKLILQQIGEKIWLKSTILTEADWASESGWLSCEVHADWLFTKGTDCALYLDLPKLEAGLVAGEGLAETLATAPLLSGDAEGETEEPLKRCDDFELFLFFFSWGDL